MSRIRLRTSHLRLAQAVIKVRVPGGQLRDELVCVMDIERGWTNRTSTNGCESFM